MTRNRLIDVSSDTSTRPTAAMYEAMASAEVGDEQKRADPTVNRLCERVAAMLGKESAVFLPSGVMSNVIGILVQCRRGDEVVTGSVAHVLTMEGGAPAAIAGVMMRPLEAERGIFSPAQVQDAISVSPQKNVARTGLISIEQTCNRGGGSVWPLETISEIGRLAKRNGVAMHMDGARLLNASIATGIPPADYAAPFDTAWIDLSKGLGCPVGSVLAGSTDLIEEAWRWKHRLGGAMRQAGVLAAAGLYALDNHVDRLAEDHENAQRLAEGLGNLPGVRLKWAAPETNMVFLDVSETGLTAPDLARRLAGRGVSIGVDNDRELRAVTHLDVSAADMGTVVRTMGEVLRDS